MRVFRLAAVMLCCCAFPATASAQSYGFCYKIGAGKTFFSEVFEIPASTQPVEAQQLDLARKFEARLSPAGQPPRTVDRFTACDISQRTRANAEETAAAVKAAARNTIEMVGFQPFAPPPGRRSAPTAPQAGPRYYKLAYGFPEDGAACGQAVMLFNEESVEATGTYSHHRNEFERTVRQQYPSSQFKEPVQRAFVRPDEVLLVYSFRRAWPGCKTFSYKHHVGKSVQDVEKARDGWIKECGRSCSEFAEVVRWPQVPPAR